MRSEKSIFKKTKKVHLTKDKNHYPCLTPSEAIQRCILEKMEEIALTENEEYYPSLTSGEVSDTPRSMLEQSRIEDIMNYVEVFVTQAFRNHARSTLGYKNPKEKTLENLVKDNKKLEKLAKLEFDGKYYHREFAQQPKNVVDKFKGVEIKKSCDKFVKLMEVYSSVGSEDGGPKWKARNYYVRIGFFIKNLLGVMVTEGKMEVFKGMLENNDSEYFQSIVKEYVPHIEVFDLIVKTVISIAKEELWSQRRQFFVDYGFSLPKATLQYRFPSCLMSLYLDAILRKAGDSKIITCENVMDLLYMQIRRRVYTKEIWDLPKNLEDPEGKKKKKFRGILKVKLFEHTLLILVLQYCKILKILVFIKNENLYN